MLNKNTVGVEKVQGQLEAALQTGTVGATKNLLMPRSFLIKTPLMTTIVFIASFHKYDRLCHLYGHLLYYKGGQVTKSIIRTFTSLLSFLRYVHLCVRLLIFMKVWLHFSHNERVQVTPYLQHP